MTDNDGHHDVHFELDENIDDEPMEDNKRRSTVNSAKSIKSIRLKKNFGLVGCVAITVGSVVGSGIFGAPNYGTKEVDSLATSLILYTAFGLISTMGAICYVEIGTSFPISGGDFPYMYIFYGPCGAFLFQLASSIVLIPADLAILATVVSIFAVEAFEIPTHGKDDEEVKSLKNSSRIALSTGILCIVTAVTCYSTKVTIYVTKFLLAVKVVMSALIVGLAIYHGTLGHAFHGGANLEKVYIRPSKSMYNATDKSEPTVMEEFFAISKGMYVTAFSYTGWTTISFIVEEIEDPYRTLPLATIISLTIITTLYILINVCYYSVLPQWEFKQTRTAASDMFAKVLDAPETAWIVPALVSLCALGVLVCVTVVSARIPFVGARYGHLPKFFSLLHTRRFTPIISLIFSSIIAIFYISLGIENLDKLIEAVTYLRLMFNGIVVAGNAYWRFKRPDYNRPFKAFIGCQIVFPLVILFLGLIPFMTADYTFTKSFNEGWRGQVSLISGLLFVVIIGLPLYFISVKMEWNGNWFERRLIKLENSLGIFFQKFFLSAPEIFNSEVQIENYKLR